MKMTIEVRDRNEGDAIRAAMEDPETRALVVVTGLLLQLPDDDARARVLHCVDWMLSGTKPVRLMKGNGSEGLTIHDAGDTGE